MVARLRWAEACAVRGEDPNPRLQSEPLPPPLRRLPPTPTPDLAQPGSSPKGVG